MNAKGPEFVRQRAIAKTDPTVLAEYGNGEWPLKWAWEKGELAGNGNYLENDEIAKRHGICGTFAFEEAASRLPPAAAKPCRRGDAAVSPPPRSCPPLTYISLPVRQYAGCRKVAVGRGLSLCPLERI